MPINVEAYEGFIDKLRKAPDAGRNLVVNKGNVVTTISPRSTSKTLEQIVVYTDWRHPGSNTYEVPSEGLVVNSRRGISDPYSPSLHGFVSSLEGDEVEVDTTKPLYLDKSSLYWDSLWKDLGLTGSNYKWEIYPQVVKVVLAALEEVGLDATGIHFVDLFGEDGDFIKQLQSRLPQQLQSTLTFHIIDASAPSLDRARKLFRENKNVVVQPAQYIHPNKQVFQEVPTPPKLVTAIGGLCGSVISREEALGITEQIYEEMAEEGLFVVTGRTGVLLNANDFLRIGFNVRQMSVPTNVVGLNPPYQLYVLKK